ncbi:multidrug effflux MFS transporter [Kineosporia babensis]|uniref:Multidrug effflux MFS transporter n=1 Tax=Kineosporia babensis TaxID=499548 RepID=A0A9X1NIT4_9ACTN|nr:multidrug effflux MFS transporter [Kineosporia babensis]
MKPRTVAAAPLGAAPGQPISAALIATVIFVTAIAPLATDMYIPAFPDVARDLATSATAVQLTLTTFFVGMALGQLVGGPVSDQRGRRKPLLAATIVMLMASIACALAPNITFMAVARFLQGFAGGWAMVIGRSVIVDLASGTQLVRALNIVQGVGGIAPIAAPLLGGIILQFSTWRAPFWVIGLLVVLMIVATYFLVPESLPPERRHAGGLQAFARDAGQVLSNRDYLGYVLVAAAAMVGLFAYVATSSFVLRTINGLSPLGYSIDFAANAAGMTVTALLAARLAGRADTRRVILLGQLIALAAGVAMLAGALWFETPLVLSMVCFFAFMCALGLFWGNAGALAADAVPDHPGTGSAVLGLLQWGTAGVAAPIAGLGGEHTAVPMALMMTIGMLVSVFGLLVVARSSSTA